MDINKKKVAVLGAGISGLVAAYELGKKGFQVEVFEKEDNAAGFAGTFEVAGKRLEKFYHHFFKSDKELLALLEELGISDHVRWLPSSMGYFINGRVYDFGTPISLINFSPLSFFGKMGFGISTLRLLLKNDWETLENTTAENWLMKNAGKEAYQTIWRPLLSAKFGERAQDVSMAWFWGKIKLRGSTKENGKEVLGYLDGSLDVLVEKLIEKILAQGGIINFGTQVLGIKREDSGLWEVKYEKSGTESKDSQTAENETSRTFDGVLSALPQPVFAKLLSGDMKVVDHTAVICTVLVMDKPLTEKYWINIGDRNLPFGGLIEHTNYLPKEEYGNKHILYLSSYMLESDPRFTETDDQLLDKFYKALKQVNPEFTRKQVLEHHIFRSKFAQPIITLGYSKNKPQHRVDKEIQGLYQTNMAVIYPEDRGVNYGIRDSIEAAKEFTIG